MIKSIDEPERIATLSGSDIDWTRCETASTIVDYEEETIEVETASTSTTTETIAEQPETGPTEQAVTTTAHEYQGATLPETGMDAIRTTLYAATVTALGLSALAYARRRDEAIDQGDTSPIYSTT